MSAWSFSGASSGNSASRVVGIHGDGRRGDYCVLCAALDRRCLQQPGHERALRHLVLRRAASSLSARLGGWGWFVGWPTWAGTIRGLVGASDGTRRTRLTMPDVEAALDDRLRRRSWRRRRSFDVVCVVSRPSTTTYGRPAVPMIAMFIQSFTESRLLFEGNWIFVIIATWSRCGRSGARNEPRLAVPSCHGRA